MQFALLTTSYAGYGIAFSELIFAVQKGGSKYQLGRFSRSYAPRGNAQVRAAECFPLIYTRLPRLPGREAPADKAAS